MWEYNNTEELYHYGVLGMKWGVRRGRTAKAYAKASKKLNKLDKKFAKAEAKAIKKSYKADKAATSRFTSADKQMKLDSKARTASARVSKKARKADKWFQTMNETFKNTDVKFSKEQVEMGRKYTEQMKNRYVGRY